MGGGSSKVRGPDGAILKGPSFPDGVTGRDKVSSTTNCMGSLCVWFRGSAEICDAILNVAFPILYSLE